MHPPVFSIGKHVAFFALPPIPSIYSLAKKKETSENTPSKGRTMSKLTQEEIDLLEYIQVCLRLQQEQAEALQPLTPEEPHQLSSMCCSTMLLAKSADICTLREIMHTCGGYRNLAGERFCRLVLLVAGPGSER